MRIVSWQLVVVIALVVVSITTLELVALSRGINGTGLALAVSALVGIPAVIITRKVSKK